MKSLSSILTILPADWPSVGILGFCGAVEDMTNMNIMNLQGLQKLPQYLQSHVQTTYLGYDLVISIFSVTWIRVSSQQRTYT